MDKKTTNGVAKRNRPSWKTIAAEKAAKLADLEEQNAAMATLLGSADLSCPQPGPVLSLGMKTAEPEPEVLTVGGKPLDPEWAHMIPRGNTDQGIAESEAAIEAKGYPDARGVRLTADSEDKKFLAYDESDTPAGIGDPLKDAASEHQRAHPELAFRFLSDNVVKRRGKRNWEYFRDDNGKKVEVGELRFASKPREEAERVRRDAVEAGRAASNDKMEDFQVNTEQFNREAGATVVTPMVGQELNSSRGWKSSKNWSANAS